VTAAAPGPRAETLTTARDHGVARFVANIHPDHPASAAVARHLGLAATDELCGGEVLWVGS
jgi:RimJ/RimL family protein N-acetyltransferase